MSFQDSKKSVEKVNREFLSAGIHNGKSLVKDFPELGQSTLVCVTEMTSAETLDKFAAAAEKILGA